MKTAAIAIIALSLTAGAAAAADRMSDSDFLKASRCRGIAEGMNIDTASVKDLLKQQGSTRIEYVQQKGKDEIARGKRDTKRDVLRPQLTAELSGECATYLGAGATVAVSKADSPS